LGIVGSNGRVGFISPPLEIAAASEIERIPADPLADCPGDGWRRQLTEQQHDVPSATWPGREGRPDQGLGFGWVAVGSESNEIHAIPALLGVLKLGGTVITIDPMGCMTARP
jgi:hypothetical protein